MAVEKLNWNNLTENKCPKCNSELYDDPGMNCTNDNCDFFITREKKLKIVEDIKRREEIGRY